MFTGSAVRVQAVQDLKLQERQEVGRRSLESGSQHPRSQEKGKKKAGARGGWQKEEEKGRRRRGWKRVAERGGEQKENPKTPSSTFFYLLLFIY